MAATALCECVALFSGRSGSSRRGGRTEMKSFFAESWTVTFVCLASRHQSRIPSSTEKQVLGRGIMGQSIPSVPIPPVFIGHFNSIQFNFIYTFTKYLHYIYIYIPGFLKTGLAKISTHSTTWQFKTIKLIQRPIKSLYLTPGSKLMVP